MRDVGRMRKNGDVIGEGRIGVLNGMFKISLSLKRLGAIRAWPSVLGNCKCRRKGIVIGERRPGALSEGRPDLIDGCGVAERRSGAKQWLR